MTEEWWVMMGEDPGRPLDGPFDDPATAMEFARQHYQLGDARLVRVHDETHSIVASTDPNEFS